MRGPRKGRDRGAAAVEFVLVLPVLLLIIFGIVDFGRMLYAKITLTQAAQTSARAAAIQGKAIGESQASRAADGLDPTPQNFSVEVHACPNPVTPGSDATSKLTFQFKFATPLAALANIGNGGVTLVSEGVSPCVG